PEQRRRNQPQEEEGAGCAPATRRGGEAERNGQPGEILRRGRKGTGPVPRGEAERSRGRVNPRFARRADDRGGRPRELPQASDARARALRGGEVRARWRGTRARAGAR